MNTSVSSLSRSHLLFSPFISVSSGSFSTRSYFSKLHFSYSTSSFLFSTSNLFHYRIDKSKFSYFNDKSIYLTGLNQFQNLFNKTLEYSEEGSLEINECVFQRTKSQSSGGAIMFDSQNAFLSIKSSGFMLSYAQQNGGAISFNGAGINISNSCFLGCLALSAGQAFEVSGSSVKGYYEFTTFDQCSPLRTKGNSVALFLKYGYQEINNINETSNHVNDMGACLCVAYNSFFSLMFSNFVGCTGGNCFWLHPLKPDDLFMNCNIVSNKANNDTGIFMFENSSVVFMGFTFIGNDATVYFMGGSLSLSQCILDVKLKNSLFSNCKHTYPDTLFGAQRLRPRPVPIFITWGCWAMGAPSPTPSQSLVPIEAALEEATMGITVLVVLLLIGFSTGFLAYYLTGKTGEVLADSKMETLTPSNK